MERRAAYIPTAHVAFTDVQLLGSAEGVSLPAHVMEALPQECHGSFGSGGIGALDRAALSFDSHKKARSIMIMRL